MEGLGKKIKYWIWDVGDKLQTKKREKRMKKIWKRELPEANEKYEHVKTFGLERTGSERLKEIAEVWYNNGMYKESAPLFEELANRGFSSEWGNGWKRYAMNLLYFGFDGVKKNMAISGELAMVVWEMETNERYLTVEKVLRTLEKPYHVKDKIKEFDRSQLLSLDAQRVEKLLNQDYEIAIEAMKSPDYKCEKRAYCGDSDHTRMILLKEAYEDLKKMGYWELSTTDELVQILNSEVEKENPAAMYWLAQCGHTKMIKMSDNEIIGLLSASVNKKYLPAIELLYWSYSNKMDDKNRETLRQNMNNVVDFIKTTYVHTRQFEIKK